MPLPFSVGFKEHATADCKDQNHFLMCVESCIGNVANYLPRMASCFVGSLGRLSSGSMLTASRSQRVIADGAHYCGMCCVVVVRAKHVYPRLGIP
jgi:hypothetical protein